MFMIPEDSTNEPAKSIEKVPATSAETSPHAQRVSLGSKPGFAEAPEILASNLIVPQQPVDETFTLTAEQTTKSEGESSNVPAGIRSKWDAAIQTKMPDQTPHQKSSPNAADLLKRGRFKTIIILSILVVLMPVFFALKDIIMMVVGTVALHYNYVPVTKAVAYMNYSNNPQTAGILTHWGEMLWEKDRQSAMEFYELAVRAAPNRGLSWACRGQRYLMLGDHVKGMADFRKAIALEPSYWWSYLARGQHYLSVRNTGAALDDFNKALELNPTSCSGLRWRAYANLKVGHWQQVIDDVSKAMKMSQPTASDYENRGWAYFKRNKLDLAKTDYESAISMSSASKQAVQTLKLITDALAASPEK